MYNYYMLLPFDVWIIYLLDVNDYYDGVYKPDIIKPDILNPIY